MIVHHRSPISFQEKMFMSPKPVRSAHLLVHEPRRRLPDRDFAAPPNRHTANPQLMIEPGARPHLDRPGCDGVEAQPGRRDRVKVRGVSKKRKDFLAWAAQPDLGLKFSKTHLARNGQILRES